MRNSPTIVVIDDDAVTLKVLSIVLNSEDVQVRSAADASIGYQLVQNEDPELIILDIHMPGKDGLNLLSDIRKNPATRETPVLMLTSDDRMKGFALDLGADGYLTKPFSPVELRQKISTLLHT
jgi:two-component system, OmpR family, alkaline phosphatase synthesis response regulator PhoP